MRFVLATTAPLAAGSEKFRGTREGGRPVAQQIGQLPAHKVYSTPPYFRGSQRRSRVPDESRKGFAVRPRFYWPIANLEPLVVLQSLIVPGCCPGLKRKRLDFCDYIYNTTPE